MVVGGGRGRGADGSAWKELDGAGPGGFAVGRADTRGDAELGEFQASDLARCPAEPKEDALGGLVGEGDGVLSTSEAAGVLGAGDDRVADAQFAHADLTCGVLEFADRLRVGIEAALGALKLRVDGLNIAGEEADLAGSAGLVGGGRAGRGQSGHADEDEDQRDAQQHHAHNDRAHGTVSA
jgi:hypothetical protein